MVQPPDEITIRISEAAAEALDRPVTDLPPLADVIDLTALDAVVSADSPQDVTVSFRYAGLCVIVRSDNTVYVYPLQEARTDWQTTRR